LKLLDAEQPLFHHPIDNIGQYNWGIDMAVMKWMAENLQGSDHTIETGCGYSTVILAALSRKHTVVSPSHGEHQLIKEWCEKQGMSAGHIEFIADISQNVLPRYGPAKFDVIPIDGDHAIPAPFIDWYYLAD